MYIALKSTNESKVHYALEPAWGCEHYDDFQKSAPQNLRGE